MEEICDGADKQVTIERKMVEMRETWVGAAFEFSMWRTREIPVLKVLHTSPYLTVSPLCTFPTAFKTHIVVVIYIYIRIQYILYILTKSILNLY